MEKQMIIGSLHFRYSRRHRLFSALSKPARIFISLIFCFFSLADLSAQCPDNIGFENGSFSNWKCTAGVYNFSASSFITFDTTPIADRHVLIKNSKPTQKDPYGNFPISCPNGSGYSIRLGNRDVNAEADGVGYTFTVPANANSYSIIYNYAVVFQNPGHTVAEQPRFIAKVLDVSAGKYIECSSFNFVASSDLPGFKKADTGAGVVYKPWSPVTIKLIGYAGKTLKIEFLVTDCTLGAHFGYAYLDINEDCFSAITGNIACLGMDSLVLTAPFGYKEYHWYDASFSRQLGSNNPLRLKPMPAAGTAIGVQVVPYPGSGCVDTLYTTIQHSPVPFSFVMLDTIGACPPVTIDLTSDLLKTGSDPGLSYMYYTNLGQTDYLTDPDILSDTGTFYVRARNATGCIAIKPITIKLDPAPDLVFKDPPVVYYPATTDITSLLLVTGNVTDVLFSYWKDEAAVIPATRPNALTIAGTYYIKASARYGCSIVRPVVVISLIPQPPNVFSPNNDGINDLWEIPALNAYPQCRLEVFDRSGRTIYHTIGYSKPWDGKVNGKVVPVGTYYYLIKASDKIPLQSGSITVLQ